MTQFLLDVSRFQQPTLDLSAVRAAGFGAVNIALTGSRGSVSGPWAEQYAERARGLGLGVTCYHWLDGRTPGAEQAAATLHRMRGLGATGHFVDVEETGEHGITPPTWAHVRDYVNAVQDGLHRFVAIYTGDWWWIPRGWPGATLTPYLMAQPNDGKQPAYPGDGSAHWAAGYGGWPNLAVMQYRTGMVGGVECSLSAIRDPDVWAALTGGSMATITWLADVLRAGGLSVVEHSGWKTHMRSGPWTPRFGVVHATAAPRGQADSTQVAIVRDGRSDLIGPIANACVDRQGRWHVLSAGRCNTTLDGTAGPFVGLGNEAALGVEACNDNGLAQPPEAWPPVQYAAYYRGWAAIAKRLGWTPRNLVGHKEHTPGRKTDPTFNMDTFRTNVARVMAGEDVDDLPTVDEVWAKRALEYVDEDGNEVRDMRPVLDIIYATHRAALRAVTQGTQNAQALALIASKVDLDPAELEQIRAAAEQGVAVAVPQIIDAFTAALPADLLDRAEVITAVETAVRNVFTDAATPDA